MNRIEDNVFVFMIVVFIFAGIPLGYFAGALAGFNYSLGGVVAMLIFKLIWCKP